MALARSNASVSCDGFQSLLDMGSGVAAVFKSGYNQACASSSMGEDGALTIALKSAFDVRINSCGLLFFLGALAAFVSLEMLLLFFPDDDDDDEVPAPTPVVLRCSFHGELVAELVANLEVGCDILHP